MVSLGTWFGWSWQDLYTHVGWPLYRKYGHAFEVTLLLLFMHCKTWGWSLQASALYH
jgi:hypothetical protein